MTSLTSVLIAQYRINFECAKSRCCLANISRNFATVTAHQMPLDILGRYEQVISAKISL